MSESKKNIEINNGWILCPSKSFPGKFYYFNVVNGETAWSQNQAENKGLKKDSSLHKIEDIAHRYPEPTTLPDESTITFDNICQSKKLDFPQTVSRPVQVPTFGQVAFPNYVPNIEPIVPNVVWTLVPMLCPENRTPMFDKVSPTMEFVRELFSHSSNVPLCKRFKNYEKFPKFETSTPKNSLYEPVSESKNFLPKSSIKKPTSNLEQNLPTPKLSDGIKIYENTVLSLSSMIGNATSSTDVPNIPEKEPVFENLESDDLRYLLLSKRKSFGVTDTAVERKKPKADEIKPRTPKKKVSFNMKDEETSDDFTPMPPNLSWSTESPKSPHKLKDKNPPSFVKENYETAPPNVKRLTPMFQPISTKQLPTFQLTATKQLATCQQTATNQTPTFQPTANNKVPTFQLTATNQVPTFQPTTTNRAPTFQLTANNKAPTFQPTATNQVPTFQPTTTNRAPSFQPGATNQAPTFQPTANNKAQTFHPTATNQVPTFQPTTTNRAPTFQPTANNKAPTFHPTATNQVPTFQLTSTNQAPTFQSTTTNRAPTFQPTTTNRALSFQPTATNNAPTLSSTATNKAPTFQPTTTNRAPTFQQTATNKAPTFQPTLTNQQQIFKHATWYVVADTDVLLLDYDSIEKLILSDSKCRLLIPHMVVSDIEALCLGDCRGQQRVINARQLTRKLATPPPYCTVEPRTSNGNLVVTTDSILQCCMKAANNNYYVVLITNDPHLLIRATSLNIPAYKLNEIQYGIDISPKSLEQKNIKMNNTASETGNTEILMNQKRSLFSDYKVIRMSEEIKKNNKSPIKRLSLSSDSETVTSLDDTLINVTKPNCIGNIENGSDSDCTSDIFVSNVQLKEKNVLKPQNVAKLPSYPQSVKENGFVNFEKRILNPNAVFNANNLEIKIPNENPMKQITNDNDDFQNDYLDYNFEDKDEFYPIPNIAGSKSKLDNSLSNKCLTLQQAPHGTMREGIIRNPSQIRIEKIMNAINTDSAPKNQLVNSTKESTAVFKIPKLLPIKNKTRNKTVHVEKSIANVKTGTQMTTDTVGQRLKNFRIKNKKMRAKINTRIDEWICTYMQIMEDVLVNLLQKHKVCMEHTVAPLTIKDTLNCIKMLYDAHTNVRDIVNKLSELLEKCMIGVQGQFKIPVVPVDFMKIFGCGVLLVQELENILPANEDLKEAKIRLKALRIQLKTNVKESDPELVKSPYSSTADKNDEEIRPPFFKSTAYVLDYLKKHFKERETYEEHLEEQNHKIENHTDFTVVRTLGKNLNLLKIDKRKNISLTNITEEDDLLNKNHEYIKRQLENDQIMKSDNTENVDTKNNNGTKLIRLNDCDKKPMDFDFLSDDKLNNTDQETTRLNKVTENIEQKQNVESKDDKFNYTSHENTFLDVEKDESKTTRKADDSEFKLNTREPLDLDLLDYSEIYEPSIDKNADFDVLSVNEKAEKNNNFNINNTFNCGIEAPIFTLEDFYITPSVSSASVKNNKNIDDSKISNESIDSINSIGNYTSPYFNTVLENNNITDGNNEEKYKKNNSEIESETFTDKQESNNDRCIENSEKQIDNTETHNYDSGTCVDNSENFGKTSLIVQDDSVNDSGFENDSTYAHSVLKVFLKELCSTFTVLHTFINKFINEIGETELSAKKMDVFHNQASKALEDVKAIINHLKAIISRESPEDTALKMLLRNAGVEATADKRMMRYRSVVMKCLEQAKILESALKIIVSTTIGDFDALSSDTENIHPDFRYFNIFEPSFQPFVGNT